MRHDTLSCLVKIIMSLTASVLLLILLFCSSVLLRKHVDSLPEPTTQTTVSENSTSSNTQTRYVPIPIPYRYYW